MKYLVRRIASLVLLAGLACVYPIHAAVWETRAQWSPDWEARYSEWVKTEWNVRFFEKPGTPFTGLLVDCADAVYSMRLIFAYQNALPFAVLDYTTGRSKVTNEMKRWDRLPEAERVRAFIRFIYDFQSTETLAANTIPIALDPIWIRAGTLILTDRENHHSWTIQNINDYGLPHLVFSSRPAKTILLEKVGYPSFGFTFPKGNTVASHAGFRAFRLPEHIGIPAWKVPGYSEEVYSLKANQWPRAVQKKLANRTEEHEARMQRLLTEACAYARDRVGAVKAGLDYLATLATGACMDAQKYDDFSTPNRDKRLHDLFEEVDLAYREAIEDRGTLSKATTDAMKSLRSAEAGAVPYCPVEWAPGRTMPLREVRRRSLQNLLSNNPHDPIENRWGLKTGNSARAKSCPVY